MRHLARHTLLLLPLIPLLLCYGCTSHPGILYPNERPVDADFGSLDSAELVSKGFALYGRKYPEATRIRWFVPVAHIRSTTPSTHVTSPEGWELVVLLGRVDVVPSATTLASLSRAGSYLCLAYFIRPGVDDTTAEWSIDYLPRHWVQPLQVHSSPIGIEDVSSYVEKITHRLNESDECIMIEPGYLANWESLFETHPFFAHPLCNSID